MDTYEGEKYYTTKENLKNTLLEYGVAIIPNVLDDNECKNIRKGIWSYFEHITNSAMKRNNQDSWKHIYKLYPLHSMLFQYWNVGHAQVSWDVRQNPKIVDIFANLWNCQQEDLLVSFDGLGFNIPPEITGRGWNRNNTWFHTDQSYTRNDFECVQSWVTALDVDAGDATLAFLEKSNNFHEDFKNEFNITDKEDWYKLTKEEEQFYIDKGCEHKKIKCPKGSMVFWDSRTIHCGSEALKGRENPKFRYIIYLSYLPRDKSTTKLLLKKQKAFNELRTTTHNAALAKMFPKTPRTYGGEIPEIVTINAPILTNLGKRLAGF